MTDEPELSISGLAKMANTTVRTIRYYESEKLLPPPVNKKGAYSFYGQIHIERLQLIALLKDRKLSLQEISHFLRNMSEDELKNILKIARDLGWTDDMTSGQSSVAEDSPEHLVSYVKRTGQLPDFGLNAVTEKLKRNTDFQALTHNRFVPPKANPPDTDVDIHWIRKELVDGVELHYRADTSDGLKIMIKNISKSGRASLIEQISKEQLSETKKQSRFFHK